MLVCPAGSGNWASSANSMTRRSPSLDPNSARRRGAGGWGRNTCGTPPLRPVPHPRVLSRESRGSASLGLPEAPPSRNRARRTRVQGVGARWIAARGLAPGGGLVPADLVAADPDHIHEPARARHPERSIRAAGAPGASPAHPRHPRQALAPHVRCAPRLMTATRRASR